MLGNGRRPAADLIQMCGNSHCIGTWHAQQRTLGSVSMQKPGRLLTLVVALAVAFGPAGTMAAPMRSQATMDATSPMDGHGAPTDMATSDDCKLCKGEQDTVPQCVAPCLAAAAIAGPDLVWALLHGQRYGPLVRRILADLGMRPEPYPPKSIILT